MALNKTEIEKFKTILEKLRTKIFKNLEETTKNVTRNDEKKGYSQHQADEGTDDFEKNINIEVSNKEHTILQQIDRSLEKIKEGTYGICDLTNEEIPIKRLEAMPYATTTVKAQEKLEKGLF